MKSPQYRPASKWRSLASWLLLIAQFQLLLLAELHNHGSLAVGSLKHVAIASSRRGATAPAGQDTVCLVCQIVRQSAARPAPSGKVVAASTSIIFLSSVMVSLPSWLQAPVIVGRAPPSTDLLD